METASLVGIRVVGIQIDVILCVPQGTISIDEERSTIDLDVLRNERVCRVGEMKPALAIGRIAAQDEP